MPEATQVERPMRFGTLSVWIALGTFAVAAAAATAGIQTATTAPASIKELIFIACGAILALAPPLHLVGVVLGITAIFRKRDRCVAGMIGAGLNVVALGLGFVLVYIALMGLATFR